ncbi:lovastatin nonaketide synthase [Aspergillus udagawae]|uniref:Lovastatin nonaketide synthase n=1 Tax=Aspergillus udagawae TaxID=91492 RepID=A0A8H3SDD3_9EURO|nr:lovastatin nonaketide synthase [Aspergillus udagawae]
MAYSESSIAVIGSACRLPGGVNSASGFWKILKDTPNLAQRIPSDRVSLGRHYHQDGSHHGTLNTTDSYFLTEDVGHFDANFFGISPTEADSIDPQGRLLLEVVYEAIENAGMPMELLSGSDTAVYVGQMCRDYCSMRDRDLNTIPTYHLTGAAPNNTANRVSYFFNWHGPSLCLDTACSSSLVAVHEAIQQLRSGGSRVAVAAGTNLTIDTAMYVALSKLHMLSPTARCRMWDSKADGYARGEAVVAVVLKTLANALQDGDSIECVIRETGVNQDGRTAGITMPSARAQAALIRDTYRRAGLDPESPCDRCQLFEAHGTGTQAGDPQEAEAIATAFFGSGSHSSDEKLSVGSVKTLIGHTEGSAGIAGLLKVSLALQHAVMTPNLHFENLNPKIEPFYSHLRIPLGVEPWPEVGDGQPRRASVNSFGFGGTNAHAIVESTEHLPTPRSEQHPVTQNLIPFTFSANSDRGLTRMIQSYLKHLKEHPSICPFDLSYTLSCRRSALPVKVAWPASDIETLCLRMEEWLTGATKEGIENCGTRSKTGQVSILGIFTGQGAQWSGMGCELVKSYLPAQHTLKRLDESLQSLPEGSRPQWTILDALMSTADDEHMMRPAFSQTLCTAVQIVLVDLLQAAGVVFAGLVGHSSGEIAAAYAGGFLNASDCIRIAYYRGLVVEKSVCTSGQRGAMLAVGTSPEEATVKCESNEFAGRVQVAARNSSSSVTLSGDRDAIVSLQEFYANQGTFARLIKVNTAYHSSHMLHCAGEYRRALERCGIQPQATDRNGGSWISSVYSSTVMQPGDKLGADYWVDNMVNPVLFSQALRTAIEAREPYHFVLEVGPHPALKSPVLQTFQDATGASLPFSGTLYRGKDDCKALSEALCQIWTTLGELGVSFPTLAQETGHGRILKDLPSYPWDHDRRFWSESRISTFIRTDDHPRHELLGVLTADSSPDEWCWRNVLHPRELPWLSGHTLQGEMVFPAAGYIVQALEGAMQLAQGQQVYSVELRDLKVQRATVIDGKSGTETLVRITSARQTGTALQCRFTSHSAMGRAGGNLGMAASGEVEIRFMDSEPPPEPQCKLPDPSNTSLQPLDLPFLYDELARVGYAYSGLFRGWSSLSRASSVATGTLQRPPDTEWLLHPAMLDTALQSIFAAWSSPGDGEMWTLFMPTSVARVLVFPSRCGRNASNGPHVFTVIEPSSSPRRIVADVTVASADANILFEAQGLEIVPVTGATEDNDRTLFMETEWVPLAPDCNASTMSPLASIIRVVQQVTRRWPHLTVLELGGDAEPLVELLDIPYASYTYASPGLDYNQRRIRSLNKRVTMRTFQLDQDLDKQGFEANRYQLVIASDLFSTGMVSVQALANIRRITTSGGYLVFTANLSPDDSNDWKTILRTTGFSGVDADSGTFDDLLPPTTTIVSQAVDLDIAQLRYPLDGEPFPFIENLVVLGGQVEVAERFMSILHPWCPGITHIPSLKDIIQDSLPRPCTLLNLLDLVAGTADREKRLSTPVFHSIDSILWDNLKTVLGASTEVLWVTQGYQQEQPYASLSVGFIRSLIYEKPDVRFQLLDLDPRMDIDYTLVSSQLLQLSLFQRVRQRAEQDEVLWIHEPEVAMRGGRLYVPRVVPQKELNARINSLRRPITQAFRKEGAYFQVKWDNGSYSWHSGGPLRHSLPFEGDITVKVQFSTLFSLPMSGGRLYLMFGEHTEGKRWGLVASPRLSSLVHPRPEWWWPLSHSPTSTEGTSLLALVAMQLAANHIVGLARKGATIVILDPPRSLARCLNILARRGGCKVVCLTSRSGGSEAGIMIDHTWSSRQIKECIPQGASLYMNLCTGNESLSNAVAGVLPEYCQRISRLSIFSRESVLYNHASTTPIPEIQEALHSALQMIGSDVDGDGMLPILSLDDLSSPGSLRSPCSIINWEASKPSVVHIRPADTMVTLSPGKSYWLVGLSLDMARSLAEWLIGHGARYVILTSRHIEQSPSWTQEYESRGIRIVCIPG